MILAASGPTFCAGGDLNWMKAQVHGTRATRTTGARRLAGTTLAGGISTSVASTDRWSVGLGLRLTHGRDSAYSPLLQGLLLSLRRSRIVTWRPKNPPLKWVETRSSA